MLFRGQNAILRVFVLSMVFVCVAQMGVNAAEVRWATRVVSRSSQYDTVDYAASQALGEPDVYPDYGDNELAWASLFEDSEREHIELGYNDPVRVQTIAIYETYNPGAIDKVSLRNEATQEWVEVWTGTATTAPEESRIFFVPIPKTTYLVDGVRVDLASSVVSGWNEIDAVAILDADPAEIGPEIVPPDLSRLETVYPELDLETVHIEVDASNLFGQVNVVTMQFLDADQNPVGSSVMGSLRDGVAADGTWEADPVIPQGTESGWYGLRIIARNSNGKATTLDIPNVQQVSQLLLRPNDSFVFTKIAEFGDFVANLNGSSFSVLGFEETPVVNDSGKVAFEARLTSPSPGSIQRSAVLIGDGVTLDIIVNDDEIPYSPEFGSSSGGSISINNAGWVSFRGRPNNELISAIYKTDGNQIVEIDRGVPSGSASPVRHAWINNSGQVSYHKYNLAEFKYEIWVGDGDTKQMYYRQEDQIAPSWVEGAVIPVPTYTIWNLGMDSILDDGTLISQVVIGNNLNSRLMSDAVISVDPGSQIQILHQANYGGAGTFYWGFGNPVAASSKGNYVFTAGVQPNGTPSGVDPFLYVTETTHFLVGRNGYKVKSKGLPGAGGNGNHGPSVNDLNVAAYMNTSIPINGRLTPQTLNIETVNGPEILIGEHHLIDGRRVDAAIMSRGALNNSNQFTFRAYFSDGHQALYRADPIHGLFVTPTFPELENINEVAGTIDTEFSSIASDEWLKLPSSSEIEILLPNGGDLITEISGISRHLAEPVEVWVEGNLVGTIEGGTSFDVAAISGGGAESIILRNIIATPSFGGTLAVRLTFNQPAVDVDVAASTAPLLVKPNTIPFLAGGQVILTSGSVGNGDYDFQWSKGETVLVESERVLGVGNAVLQIFPGEANDAGIYTLVGTGVGGKTSSIQVPLIEGKTFDTWIGEQFPGEDSNSIIGADATPMVDGISNFVKFALGVDPTLPIPSSELEKFAKIVRGQSGATFSPVLTLSVNPEAIGFQIGIESAPDLNDENWTLSNNEPLAITETIVNGVKNYVIQLPATLDPNQFYRVSIRSAE